MSGFTPQEFLAIELQEQLRSSGCNVTYETALQQVKNFVEAEARALDLSQDEYLEKYSAEGLLSRWVEKVFAVAVTVGEEIERQYPLLALPLKDTGTLIAMLATTVQAIQSVGGHEDITDAALQIIGSLGLQLAALEKESDLCLLTQVETFALVMTVRGLMDLPPDVTSEPHMEWVESCSELLEACFEQIAGQLAAGKDLSSPEQRVFVVSLMSETDE